MITDTEQLSAEQWRERIQSLSDREVIALYEREEGRGPIADGAADEMERRISITDPRPTGAATALFVIFISWR